MARPVTAVAEPLRLDEMVVRQLPEACLQALYVVAPSGTIQSWNWGAEILTGYAPAEAVGRDWLDLVVPQDEHDAHRNAMREASESGHAILQSQRRAKDGTLHEVMASLNPIRTSQGVLFAVFEQDLSDQRRLERQLFERIWSLDEARAELARSNLDLEQFAYVASHDLQEPLRMVGSFVKLIAQDYGPRLDERGHQFVGFAVDGAMRMQHLIDDLLAYSRVTTRAKPFSTIDSNDMLQQVLKNLAVPIQESHAKITHDPLPRLVADASQLTQVFQNLLSNSLKFRGSRPTRIHIGAQQAGAEWVFSVQDNGIGFEMEYADRLFQLFHRLHERSAFPGTGIGLAICKKIVSRHGGRIWAESQPGRGSVFRFAIAIPGNSAGGPRP